MKEKSTIAGTLDQKERTKTPLSAVYPAIAEYCSGWGWIEVGEIDDDGYERKGITARAMDAGGMIWESKRPCKNAEQAFRELEVALEKVIELGS